MAGSKKMVIFLGIATFAVMALLGMSVAMSAHAKDKMPNCPFTNHSTSLCEMNPMDRVAMWQGLFTTVMPHGISLLVLLGFIAFAFYRTRQETPDPPGKHRRIPQRRDEQELSFFDPLSLAFSDGVLNPKIYSIAFNSR